MLETVFGLLDPSHRRLQWSALVDRFVWFTQVKICSGKQHQRQMITLSESADADELMKVLLPW